jgi:predicted nuclease of predicted toxin-antitoxin system
MRFLIDAQLPRRFCIWLKQTGHDALHTLDLPAGNRTTDSAIIEFADQEDRVVVTKDDDFVRTRLVLGKPKRLLLMATGNIGNAELEKLVQRNLSGVIQALEDSDYVEISRQSLICHD